MSAVLNSLKTHGWALITDAGFTDGVSVDHAEVLRIARHFGKPSDRDGGTPIWPVTPRDSGPSDTFSVRDGEAQFHTDAAYRADPEQRFALFCVRPAEDGGSSRLLRTCDAMSGLPRKMLSLLRRPIWRWVPPATFGGPSDVARRVWTRDGRIRWRVDNLNVSANLRTVGQEFAEYLESHSRVAEHRLVTDSVLVCDNERLLHGRTWFSDPRRMVLRVRLITQ